MIEKYRDKGWTVGKIIFVGLMFLVVSICEAKSKFIVMLGSAFTDETTHLAMRVLDVKITETFGQNGTSESVRNYLAYASDVNTSAKRQAYVKKMWAAENVVEKQKPEVISE